MEDDDGKNDNIQDPHGKAEVNKLEKIQKRRTLLYIFIGHEIIQLIKMWLLQEEKEDEDKNKYNL